MLTQKQHNLLMFIHKRLEETGVAPSFDEMKDSVGLKSKSGIHRLIQSLEERGFILKLANKARALEVIRLPDRKNSVTSHNTLQESQPSFYHPIVEQSTVPLLGKIAAGTPIEAISTPNYMVDVPASMLSKTKESYALEIDGDSMQDIGIMDGDTVLIERTNVARDGEIVVALVDKESATLKTFFNRDGEIELRPENSDHSTQIYSADRIRIQGRLTALLRKY